MRNDIKCSLFYNLFCTTTAPPPPLDWGWCQACTADRFVQAHHAEAPAAPDGEANAD